MLALLSATIACTYAAPAPSIARVWNDEILAAIRIDLPHPPVHARNLFHLSVAMYDAWAAYDPVAIGYLYHEKHTAADSYLTFERGPSEAVQLQWATYYDAADQAGLSRIWGGIHPPADDLAGRHVGAECGRLAWRLARQYFDGAILRRPTALVIQHAAGGGCEVQFETVRGFSYQLQFTPDVVTPWQDDLLGKLQAVDSIATRPDRALRPGGFYRVLRTPGP